MPHIKIDGHLIETSPGKTIIQAAYENGMQIPHFCWHPELTVAGNCRMCLVEVGMPKRNQQGEIEKDENGNDVISFFPKLQIACATPVSDGMVVRALSEKAVEAQEAVMEFILINHPLDCPICDEAGECKLQEYAFKHSKGESRFDEQKNHAKKRQVWGPNVIFDGERCISCSRCIRFSSEIAKQDVLSFVQRGDHVTIELFDGTVLDNPYSMNVIELCPVGALTSQDFRFKARVWDMSFNDSISFADGSGSNISIGVRNNEILRIQPRTNMFVNKHWLTDDARLNYIELVNQNRITEPHIRVNGDLEKANWQDAIIKTADSLKKYKANEIFVLTSAKATIESNYLMQKFAKTILKTQNIDFLHHIDNTKEDGFLSVADRAPNTSGAREVGATSIAGIKAIDLADKIKSGEIKALIAMEEDFTDFPDILNALSKLELLVSLQYNNNKVSEIANIVLPASTYAESEGTYANHKGRVQHLKSALVTKENMRYMGLNMSRLDKFGALNDRWTQHEVRNCRMSWRIVKDLANAMGANWQYFKSENVFDEIEKNVASFKGMSYHLLDEYQGIQFNKASNPDPKLNNYVSHVMKPH